MSLDNQKKVVEKFVDIDFGLVDIYFPYKDHLASWKAGQDLIVVPVSPAEVENNKYVDGFNLDGDKVQVPTFEQTETPVLVVTFSEKRGNYKNEYNVGSNTVQTGKGNKITTTYEFRLRNIYIKHQYDGGLLGDMEIYVKTKQNSTEGGAYGSWHEHGTWSVQHNDSHDFASPYPLLESQGDDDWEMQIEVWEDDGWGSGDDDFVADVSYDRYRVGQHNVNWSSWTSWGIRDIPYNFTLQPHIQLMDGADGSQDYDCVMLARY